MANRPATKGDLAQLEVRVDEKFAYLRNDISELRKDMDARFELTNKDMDTCFGSINKDMDTHFALASKYIDTRFELASKDMDTHFELASKDMDIKLYKLKDTLVAWLIGLFLAQTSLLVGLFKLLPTSSVAV